MKDERGRPEVGLRRKAVTLAGVILILALIVGSLFGDRGLLQLMRQREQVAALARELGELRGENGRLASEIRALLAKDPRVIERLAREELGLVGPGETVFVIREDVASDRP